MQGYKVKHHNRDNSKFENNLHTQLLLGRSFLAAHSFEINFNKKKIFVFVQDPRQQPTFFKHFL